MQYSNSYTDGEESELLSKAQTLDELVDILQFSNTQDEQLGWQNEALNFVTHEFGSEAFTTKAQKHMWPI